MNTSALPPGPTAGSYNLDNIPTGAKVPVAATVAEISPSTGPSAPLPAPVAHISSSTGLRQQLSRGELEQIKPLIFRMYIEEDRTFSYIAESLAVSHNFRPTKKQFTTKIKEWGFKKNLKRHERIEVLQSVGPMEGDIRIDLTGRKHKRQKLIRWENESKKEVVMPDMPNLPSEESRGTEESHESEETASTKTVSSATVSTATIFQAPSDEMSASPERQAASIPRVGTERRIWVKEDDEEWKYLPHARWMNADVLNSPKFSRLLSGLGIETGGLPDDIEEIALPAPSVEQRSTSEKEIVTWSELSLSPRDECSSDSFLIGIGDNFSDRPTFGNFANLPIEQPIEQRLIQSTSKPIRFRDIDALFPSGDLIERTPSPFNELYPFPPSEAPGRLRSSVTLVQTRQKAANDLFSKLRQLRRGGAQENHPGVLGVTNQLADVFYDSGNMTRANSLYRQVLALQKGDCETWSEKALHAQIGLIDGLCRLGHPVEARGMLEGVSAAMAKRYDPAHVIFRRLSKARIEIFNWLEDWDAEEPVARDLTQICLVNLGPRDPETLNAVYRLASVMKGQARYPEGEELMRKTLHICEQGTEKHYERMAWSSLGLGRMFDAQGRFDEAITLLQASSKRNGESVGDEHEASMICNYHLGRILGNAGRLEESEELLRSTIELQLKVLGEGHINPHCTMFELGGTLLKRKKYEESAYWLEKCFRKTFTLSNFEFTTKFCKRLGTCYEEQGRYTEAMAFYQEAMAFLQAEKEKTQHTNVDVYIAKIQDLIDDGNQHINKGNT